MKKFMGTPGPWVLVQSDNATPFIMHLNGEDFTDVSDYTSLVCSMPAEITCSFNSLNNARLIAAAPDLLEALQDLVNDLVNSDDEGLVEHAEPIVAARAAIAKALGNTS